MQEKLMSDSAGLGYFVVRLVLSERQAKSFEGIQNTEVQYQNACEKFLGISKDNDWDGSLSKLHVHVKSKMKKKLVMGIP